MGSQGAGRKEKQVTYEKERRQRAKAAGKCYGHVNNDVVPGKVICSVCVLYRKKRFAAAKLNWHCQTHPDRAPAEGKTYCGECLVKYKNYGPLAAYGISSAEKEELLQVQEGACAICKCEVLNPVVDHDHETGQVRGVLCGLCNRGLGHFKDSPQRLRSAAAYLKKHKQRISGEMK